MLHVKIETENPGRLTEVQDYYERGNGMNVSLERVLKDLKAWYSPYGGLRHCEYQIGAGASHVWLADKNGERLLIITEK